MKKKNPDQDARITEISQFIRNWRMNDMISMSDLARMAGTHPNTIHNIESGKNVTLYSLLSCLDALGLTMSELFEGVE
jgi:transcriptional regulator with XRE-family HTH domain